MDPRYDWAAGKLRELIAQWLDMRRKRLLHELSIDATARELEDGYLGRSVRKALIEAAEWGERRTADGETLPPPNLADQLEPDPRDDWDDITPMTEPGYEVDFADADTRPGWAKHSARERPSRAPTRPITGSTLPGMPTVPPPPPPAGRRGPPPLPPLPPKRR